MKKLLLLATSFSLVSVNLFSQCITMSGPASSSVTNNPGVCGAVVTYATPTAATTCVGSIRDTFQYTGASQTFVVPVGITSLTIETWGAQGGANWVNNVNYGGYVKGDIAVTPGETLTIYVGQQPTTIIGGFNGGGNGEGAGKGGGGATDVRQGGTAYANRVVVAGGGGGAGYWSNLHVVGGVGGGLTGGDGYRDPSYAANPGGQGGTQSASGYGTCISFNNMAMTGGFGYGGAPAGCGCEGYGGGGGWYGGAGSGNCRGGGGGSGYLIPAATNISLASGVRIGNGMCVISMSGGSSIPTITQTAGLPSSSVFPIGTTTNTFTALDAFGNTATYSFSVTVTDTEFPTIANVPSSISQNNDAGQCGAIVNWTAPTASDNCSVSLSSNHNSGDLFPLGTTLVTYTAVDPAGNTTTSTFNVTVIDSEFPVISNTPSTITQNNDIGQCGAIVTWNPATASDNCSYTLSSDHNSGDLFPIGNTVVTYTATDGSNSTTSTFTVTVTDNEAPNISVCAAAVSVLADAGQCTASNVSLGTVTATDNCSVANISNDAPSLFPVGNTTVTWTVTDVNGVSSTCIQSVSVGDGEFPVISGCPNDITMCEGVVTYNTPVATDNCSTSIVTQTSGPSSGSSLTAGNYTVTFDATDASGNTTTCSFSITVNAPPTVTLNLTSPATVCFDDANYALAGASPVGGTWSGNGVSGSSFDPSAAGNGMQLITYTFVDNNGCEANATDSILVSQCVGINEHGNVSFNLYPNPASSSFWFESNGNGSFELYNMNGQLVLTQTITSAKQEIGLTGLADGIYNVKYTTGGIISNAKLTIKK